MKRDDFLRLGTSGMAGLAIANFPRFDKMRALRLRVFVGSIELGDILYLIETSISLKPTLQPTEEDELTNLVLFNMTSSKIIKRSSSETEGQIIETFAESHFVYNIKSITANPIEENVVTVFAEFGKLEERRHSKYSDLPDIDIIKEFKFLEDGLLIKAKYIDSSIDAQAGIQVFSIQNDHIIDLRHDPSACFLTSATIKSKGLKDDCYELETLRRFRDEYMLSNDEGRALVKEYYTIAPSIVALFDLQENSEKIYSYLYDTLITDSIKLIEEREFSLAMNFYKEYTQKLFKMLA